MTHHTPHTCHIGKPLHVSKAHIACATCKSYSNSGDQISMATLPKVKTAGCFQRTNWVSHICTALWGKQHDPHDSRQKPAEATASTGSYSPAALAELRLTQPACVQGNAQVAPAEAVHLLQSTLPVSAQVPPGVEVDSVDPALLLPPASAAGRLPQHVGRGPVH